MNTRLAMRKTNQKSLVLDCETVRALQKQELAAAAGGSNSYVICPRTADDNCPMLSVSCAILCNETA